MSNNKKLWEELHSKSKFRPKYPSETVVQFVFRNFDRDNSKKVLDLGCGSGRHVFFMGNEGIIPYGLDFSSEGVFYTQQMLKEAGMDQFVENIKVGPSYSIPFDDDFFDGIVCFGVLYYMKREEINKSVNEINRVLKKGGKALIMIRTVDDYRCHLDLNKEAGENNTFYLDSTDENKCASNERGMIMHFFEENEVAKLFSTFNCLKIDKIEETHNNGDFKDSNYLVVVEK